MAAQVDAALAGERDALGAQQRHLLLWTPPVPRPARLAAMVDHAVRGDANIDGASGEGVADEARVARPPERQREVAIRGDMPVGYLRDQRVNGLVEARAIRPGRGRSPVSPMVIALAAT